MPVRCIPILLLVTTIARAQSVNVTDCEVVAGDREATVRGALEVEGLPHRRLGVFFQARLSEAEPFRGPDGTLLVNWGEVFTPEDQAEPVRWSACVARLPFDLLERSPDLPRGARTTLWIACDVWDPATKTWIASGWNVRCPILVTTDAGGRITACAAFYTTPHGPHPSHPWETKPARTVRLELAHLRLAPGVQAFRCVGEKHVVHDLLYRDGKPVRQAELASLQRGWFFAPPESDTQARELAALGHRGAAVVSQEAYGALKAHEKRRETAAPPNYGIEVTPVADVGWRVGLLLVVDGNVRHVRYNVARDGRLSMQETTCLEGWYIDPATDPVVRDPARLLDAAAEIRRGPRDAGAFLEPKDWPEEARR
jgi:hypothetical protein